MDISITEAIENELPQILDLYENVLDKDKQILSLSEAQTIFLKMSQYPDYHLYTAKFKGRVIGSFALLIMDNLAHFGTPSAIVEDVVVAVNYQNLGIGRQMMQFVIEKAKEKGCYKLVLSSNKVREKAHSFYEKLGFEKHGYSFKIEF